MKRTFHNTNVSVKLRKSNRADEWYLVVESYPVYEKFSDKPKRIRENINRVITTPLWDKSKTTRGGAKGKEAYMPKRDVNGVIQCKAAVDQRACLYADKIREARQREYDNAALYTETETAQAEQNERSKCNFIEYVKYVKEKRHGNSSKSIIVNWNRLYEVVETVCKWGLDPIFGNKSEFDRGLQAMGNDSSTRWQQEWNHITEYCSHLFLHL